MKTSQGGGDGALAGSSCRLHIPHLLLGLGSLFLRLGEIREDVGGFVQ